MQLLELFQKANLTHFLTQEFSNLKFIIIKNITNTIQDVTKGSIFIAITGSNTDGNTFIEEAFKKGAALVIVENKDKLLEESKFLKEFISINNLPLLEVIDTKAIFSILIYSFHVSNLKSQIITITGTNGKSSTAFFTSQFLNLLKYKTMIVGTLGIFVNGKKISDSLTTPDAKTLIPFLQLATTQNIDYIIIEASSHGLDQKRILGLNILAAGFTNLTQDHLDYHKTISNYYSIKKTLFSKFLNKQGTSVINVDDKFGDKLQKDLVILKKKIITYGFKSNDFQIISIENKPKQQIVNFFYNDKYLSFKVNLLGKFQIYNIICSMLLIISTNKSIHINSLIPLCEKLTSVSGRLEYIGQYNQGLIYVDYAHTPNALEEVLLNLREHCNNKLKVVFGCGGNRDVSKRKIMGKIASKLADEVYITDDNPREEDPITIRNQIIEGLIPKTIYYSLEREQAITNSIASLTKGDILVIAGKGHETTQILKNNQQIFFSDILFSLEVLKKLTNPVHKNNLNNITIKQIPTPLKNINTNTNPHTNYKFNQDFLSKALKLDITHKVNFNHIAIDTRTIQKDSLFIALNGKTKGSSYVLEAFKQGAKAALVNESDKTDDFKLLPIIYVKNTLNSLQELAVYFRKQFTFPLIGITGSVGKTSTKDLISYLLSKKFLISKTLANFNNHLGLPISLLSADLNSKYGVFELGMSKAGEIKNLSSILKPSIAIITSVESAHSEFFANTHEIAKAKSEIIENLPKDGILVLNKDNRFYDFFIEVAKKHNIKNIFTFGEHSKSDFYLKSFNIKQNKEFSYHSEITAIIKGESYTYTLNNTIYKHQALLSVLSLGILSILTLNIKDYLPTISNYPPTVGRGNLVTCFINKKQVLLINDSYNASIESMTKGITSLNTLNNNRKILVLGDVLEISNTILEHLSLSNTIIKAKPSYVLTIGSSMKRLTTNLKFKNVDFIVENFPSIKDLEIYLEEIIEKNDIIFIKGSHGSNVYQIANKYNNIKYNKD
jgi:murE/murF fusion protein